MGGWCDERAGLRRPEDGSLMAPTAFLSPFTSFFFIHLLNLRLLSRRK